MVAGLLTGLLAGPLQTIGQTIWQPIGSNAAQVAWAIASIVIVEMVRDFYHVLSHRWAPLQQLHNWHHRAYKKDFSPVSIELYRQAQLRNDAPEALFMIAVMAAAAVITHTP
ncbi:MAG: hypothetical protein WBD47_14370, partial [Phormidesmis sp.]